MNELHLTRPTDADPERPSIFVALPGYSGVMGGTAMSLFCLGAYLASKGVGCSGGALNYPDIAECRNVFLSVWYDKYPTSTHLLFVDSDMRFAPELVHDMIAINKPLVGCIYRRKGDVKHWVGKTRPGPQDVENGFLQVEGIGMGVTLIARTCIDQMVEKYPELIFDIPVTDPLDLFGPHKLDRVLRFFDKISFGYAHMSEDFAFCKRYRDIGGEVYANVAHPIGHIGLKEYGGRLWDDIAETNVTPYHEAAE